MKLELLHYLKHLMEMNMASRLVAIYNIAAYLLKIS